MTHSNHMSYTLPINELDSDANYDVLGDLFQLVDRQKTLPKSRKPPGLSNPRRWWLAVPLPFDTAEKNSTQELGA